MKLGNADRGINTIKDRLCRQRVLLILDDVDDEDQLQALAGGFDWFGPGSRIIITTRDKHLLTAHQVALTYEVKKLNHHEALQLFSWNAFKRSEPDASYFDISNRAVCYAEGLPLALTILGSDLCGRSTRQWESALGKYKRNPNRKVQDILRISFDGLEENEKEIFLYIACFFKGEIMEYAVKALNACDLHPTIGIAVLVDKSLITLDERFVLRMHDLIQDMGKEIVRQEAPLNPGKRSRLWYYEDVLQVLNEGMGTDKIQGIMLDLPEKQEAQLSVQDLTKMKNLRMLIVRNAEFSGGLGHLPSNLRLLDWEEYPLPCLPSDFLPEKLAMLELRHSHLTLEKPFKKYTNLTSMNFSSCEFLTKIPDVSGIPNLEQLILEDCTRLVEIHESLGLLDKLVYFGVERCTELKNLPNVLKLPSLACIALNGCSKLERFPDFLGKMEKLKIIEIEETAIQELPSSVFNFSSLQILVLKCCSNLKELPGTIDMLPNLQLLDISGCRQLQLFPEKLRSFRQKNCSTMSPESSEGSSNLEVLPSPCRDSISPGIHSSYGFPLMENLDLSDCNLLDEDLHILSCFSNLTSLDISRNHFETLPKCFHGLSSLQELYMANCRKLQEISGIPPNLEHIDATSCTLLNSQSLSLLLSQGFYKASKYEVIAPRSSIPMTFTHQSKGGSLSFWIGQEFPRIALCFLFELGNKITGFFTCEVQLSINGQKASNRVQDFLSVVGDLTWLYHQEDLVDLNTHLLHEQNYVEVSCKIIDASKAAEVAVYCCGAHEYQEDEEVKKPNLLFYTNSCPPDDNTMMAYKVNGSLDNNQFSRETHDDEWHYDDNLGIACCSLPKNLRLYEVSDAQSQELLASISPEMLQADEFMDPEKGKTTVIMSADVMHQTKEMPSLHLQPSDLTWDPMLLECQLSSMNENKTFHYECHTSENKGYLNNTAVTEVGSTLVGALVPPTEAGTKAFDKVVLKLDSEYQKKIRLKTEVVLVESEEKPEAPIITANLVKDMGDQPVHGNTFSQLINPEVFVQLSENSSSLRKRKENSWNEDEAARAVTFKSEPSHEVPPTNHPAENIMLADQESEPKGHSVLEHETKRDELDVIPMEHNTNQFDLTLMDGNMEAFYTALHAETFALSPLGDTRDDTKLTFPKMSEETEKALETLKEFLSKQFCHLLDPGSSTSMKTILEYLCTLSADDDVSLGLKSLMLQLSRYFTQWSREYVDASMKLESSTAGLSKLDTLEEGLIANKNQFGEFVSIEHELCSQLSYLEERKKELEEQINAIKANITISAVARDTALRKKRETFEEGRTWKAQRDELRKHRPRLRAEQESAKVTKANIEDEWSKIREQFDRILNVFGSH